MCVYVSLSQLRPPTLSARQRTEPKLCPAQTLLRQTPDTNPFIVTTSSSCNVQRQNVIQGRMCFPEQFSTTQSLQILLSLGRVRGHSSMQCFIEFSGVAVLISINPSTTGLHTAWSYCCPSKRENPSSYALPYLLQQSGRLHRVSSLELVRDDSAY